MSETLSNNDNSQSSESLTSIEQTLNSLKTDLRSKKQHIETIRNIIHNDKVTYNCNIKKYLDLNQQIIVNEREIENIDKQISSIVKKQKLFKTSLNKTFYANFKDAYNHLNVDKVIPFFEFCGFNNVDEHKCVMLKRMVKNENELLYMILHGERHQKDLYKNEYNEFQYTKMKINETNKDTLPYVYEQLFMYIVSVYNKIELHSLKDELMSVNNYNYETKNKTFLTLKQLEYAIVQNSRIYRQLYSYIKGAKLMLINYNKIKHNINKELVNGSATNSISHSNSNHKNNYGVYLNFVKCVKEFRKNHWRTNLFLSNEFIRNVNKPHSTINNDNNDDDNNNTVIEHPGEIQHINDLSMSVLSEFCDDEKSEISSVNRDLVDTHNNINVIYKNISLSKRNKTSKSQMSDTKSHNTFFINTKHIKHIHHNNNTHNHKVICNKTISNIQPILSKNVISKPHSTMNVNNVSRTSKTINYKHIRLVKSRTANSFQKQKSFSPSTVTVSPNKISPLKCKTPSTTTPIRKYKKIKKTFVSRNERSNVNYSIEHKYRNTNMNHTFQSSTKFENKSTKDDSTKAHLISTSFDKMNSIKTNININNNNNINHSNNNEEVHLPLNMNCVCDEMLSVHTNNQLQLQITKMKQNKFINFNQSKRKSFTSNYSNIKIDPKIHKCDCCMSCT